MQITLPYIIAFTFLQAGCRREIPKINETSEQNGKAEEVRSPFEGRWQYAGSAHPWFDDKEIFGYSGILIISGSELSVTYTKTGESDEYYSTLLPVFFDDLEEDSVTYQGTITKYIFVEGDRDAVVGNLSDPYHPEEESFYVVDGLPHEKSVAIRLGYDDSPDVLLLGSHDPPWRFTRYKKANKKPDMATPNQPPD